MNNTTRTARFALAALPLALRNLVKLTGFRPATVEVTLTVNPAEVHEYWRTGSVFSLGELLAEIDTSRMNDGGEWDSSSTKVYSAPVAIAVPKCGGRSKNEVRITVGGLHGFEALLDNDAEFNRVEITPAQLSVMVDAALSDQV